MKLFQEVLIASTMLTIPACGSEDWEEALLEGQHINTADMLNEFATVAAERDSLQEELARVQEERTYFLEQLTEARQLVEQYRRENTAMHQTIQELQQELGVLRRAVASSTHTQREAAALRAQQRGVPAPPRLPRTAEELALLWEEKEKG